ncbi:hypothetical protein JSY36_12975 [Bacillus sp. H-16]|uniref:hypothetical protein n=1 Tax=Alteribacter salitolerans TaxID=2912333 RepID=UPI001964CADB|nr:hypothetical protein [Alteribacter salitolerans]MBM7096661.1 hypothetical protein [Alteribacter salitolerans]
MERTKGLTGWLCPNGIFISCEYGEHRSVLPQLTKSTYEEAINSKFINITSDTEDSTIGIYSKPTKEQINWLIENHTKFDYYQASEFKAARRLYKF